MRLDKIKNANFKKKKRIGRGPGSGHGKTSGRGHKGQKARAGRSTWVGFEGGQMPLIRRIPKRGFTSPRIKEFRLINLKDLNQFENNAEVNLGVLKEKGFTKKENEQVKILGCGKLKVSLSVKAHSFSKTALKKIEEAGGKAIKIPEHSNTKAPVKKRAPKHPNTGAPVKK